MMPDHHEKGLSAAILVGGRARRMAGLPKGLFTVEGKPLVNRLAQLLDRLTTDLFLVGPPDGPYGELGLPIYADVFPDRGAPGGVHAALQHAENEWVIIVSCDLPKLDEKTLESLRPDDAADVVMYRSEGYSQPLAALWRQTAIPILERCLSTGNPGFSEIQNELRLKYLDIDPGQALTNVNTPEDAERAGLVPGS